MVVFLLGILVGGSAVSFALYRTRKREALLEEEKQQVVQSRELVVDFMHHMVEALGEGLGQNELRQRIVHAAILCSGALSAALFEREGKGQMRGVAVEGLFPPHRPLPPATVEKLTTRAKFIESVLRGETFPDDEGIIGAVVQTGEAQLVADAASDPRIVRHQDPALKVRSVIAVPLAFRGELFGVLAVANSADGLPFSAADFTLMQSLAEQAALALHNLRLLNYQIEKQQLDLDLSLASGIQQMLLPTEMPSVPGLALDARYTPAQKVSGDLYDLFLLSPTRLGVVVADVSGKGIPASLLMAICRTHLRQIAPRHDSPAAALCELNRVIGSNLVGGMFITLLYAVIDLEQSTVTLARAGHELPLFLRQNAISGAPTAEFVGSEGMALGMMPPEIFDAVIADRSEPFRPGETLILYTDGLTEAPNEDEKEFSGTRLADVARTLHRRSAHELADGILEAVNRFTGGSPQRDDLTLLTVKREGGGGAASAAAFTC
ncbi:protein serine phosphatase [Cephaloticoccus primus]|uniref:Protein serine phosphatase n=1 Tax=Cephaloticoccus primus TaxID=1548207 RepID=A0A139SN29_9BACT|nr:GAF domain-containing SpoIIE family protein phosphatase [Cephaloticoccus primus]KXU35955.1 protein serine phosphatase [Cephaloticoccus primus]